MNLDALVEALESRTWAVPVEGVRCHRIRQVEGVGEDGESAVWFERDELEIGDEAMVVVDGFPLAYIGDHRVLRVMRIFSIEFLEDYTVEEAAEMLADSIEEKFREAR